MSLMGSMDIGQRALRSHGLRLDVHSNETWQT